MTYPPQAPPQSYGPPPSYQPPKKGAGLAIAAMVLGIIALLLSWIPIINNGAAVLALVGLGLAIPALLRARRGTHGGMGMAITGLVTTVLALVVVFVTQAFYADVIDEVQQELDRAADGVTEPAAQDPAAQDPTDVAPVEEPTEVVPLGVPAQVGDYQVRLDAVELDANATVAAANQFNEPAANGQYVMTQFSVTYTGTEEGFPGMDLTAVVHGSDNRQYSDSDCAAVLPDDAMQAPTLNPGGSDTFQFCMDVPPAALAGAQLSVEPTMSWDSDARVFYALG
ncbi:DUF4190 domain-containing protein [Blastococcus xanthinilyticus]|uniref:DUF4190 domain-containing protein n=1 Tax=Blastococcus xanthinilyticus TaxID=1564164 RepID=A0A5S5CM45_9ACTN|nr:DUF4190 domain-containing protein [Blastococcus xanthinilyticus]TYP82811.1 hypothetical protein BD833_11847 [Blastococcus xanthinilyticus]